jgi:hypothetical protein
MSDHLSDALREIRNACEALDWTATTGIASSNPAALARPAMDALAAIQELDFVTDAIFAALHESGITDIQALALGDERATVLLAMIGKRAADHASAAALLAALRDAIDGLQPGDLDLVAGDAQRDLKRSLWEAADNLRRARSDSPPASG